MCMWCLSFVGSQVDNQLLGTTQPVMLCVTPGSSESSFNDSGPALQVNSVKVPSNLMLTDLFKVRVPPWIRKSFYLIQSFLVSFAQSWSRLLWWCHPDVFTAPHGDGSALHCHHRGEAAAQAAQLLWIRTDRAWWVISWMWTSIPVMLA